MKKVLYEDAFGLMKVVVENSAYYFTIGNLEVRGPFESDVECYQSVCSELTCVLAQVIEVFSEASGKIDEARCMIKEKLCELIEEN